MLCSLLYDVEWNTWVWNHNDHYKISRTVSSKCDSKFTLAKQAPTVVVDKNSYSIVNGNKNKGQGAYATGTPFAFGSNKVCSNDDKKVDKTPGRFVSWYGTRTLHCWKSVVVSI